LLGATFDVTLCHYGKSSSSSINSAEILGTDITGTARDRRNWTRRTAKGWKVAFSDDLPLEPFDYDA
jgi:hypothetical protein